MKKLFFALSLPVLAMISQAYLNVPAAGYAIGDTVEDFKLENIDGAWIQFSDFMGEGGAVVVFTCNTCPYAQLYEDRLIKLNDEFSGKGFPILAINPNDPKMKPGDSFEAMKKRSADKGFTFPYVFDAEQTIFPKFGATRTPHAYVVDSDMKLRYIGAIDDNPQNATEVKTNYIKDAIAAIKAGMDPDPLTTKAIGCGIKARKAQWGDADFPVGEEVTSIYQSAARNKRTFQSTNAVVWLPFQPQIAITQLV